MRAFLSPLGVFASQKRQNVSYKRIPTSLAESSLASRSSSAHPPTTFEMSSLSSRSEHAPELQHENKSGYAAHHAAVSTREVDTGALVGEEEVFLDEAEALRIRCIRGTTNPPTAIAYLKT